jgi:hypothetical protein
MVNPRQHLKSSLGTNALLPGPGARGGATSSSGNLDRQAYVHNVSVPQCRLCEWSVFPPEKAGNTRISWGFGELPPV